MCYLRNKRHLKRAAKLADAIYSVEASRYIYTTGNLPGT